MKLTAAALIALTGSIATADVAFNNFGPGDSYSGNGYILYGPQASPTQWTQGFQFTAQAGGPITKLVIPVQYLNGSTNNYSFEIYSDAGDLPGASIGVIGQTAGFINNSPPLPPPIEILPSGSITLTSGTKYWVVGFGSGDTQGTWHQNDNGQMGLRAWMAFGLPWQPGQIEMAAFRIEVAGGAPACYANCDNSTSNPVLTANDFQCFLNHYAAGDSVANCDGSTSSPLLTANDFQCFLNKYAAGCS